MNTAASTTQDFIYKLPKVELHAHLNTSYSLQFLQEHAQQSGTSDQVQAVNDLCIRNPKDLDTAFKLFTTIQQLFRTEDSVYKLTCSVIKEFAEDNVKYLELRSTPKHIPETGMTRELYMSTMVRAVRDCEAAGVDITVRLLVSIDRRHGVDTAKIAVELAEKMMKSTQGLVLGVDFSGDPQVGDATDYIPVFLEAAKKGLKLSLHLEEIPLHEETLNVLRACGPHCKLRIGHGTFLHRSHEPGKGHHEIEDLVLKWRIPIEACLTSNLMSQTVDSPGSHHFHYWLSKEHPVIICTDGKGAFCCTLSEEYEKFANEFSFGKKDLIDYARSTIDSIFAENDVKERLKEKLDTFANTELGRYAS